MNGSAAPDGLSRYRGALLGLAAGDALGTTLEFKPRCLHPRTQEAAIPVDSCGVSSGSTSMEELLGVPWRFGGSIPWRVHTEFVVDGEQVHIDICGTPDGSGGAWNETRVHVNGELLGLAASHRCSPVAAEREEEPALAVVGQHVVEVHRPSSIREAAQCGGVRVDVRRLLR